MSLSSDTLSGVIVCTVFDLSFSNEVTQRPGIILNKLYPESCVVNFTQRNVIKFDKL